MSQKATLLSRYKRALHQESFSGIILSLAAVISLVWANSPLREYFFDIADFHVGISAIHLELSIAHWASDGLLAVFFFVVGLELKAEFVTGSLRDPRKALVPIIAAATGMLGPIFVYTVIQHVTGYNEMGGWAIPVATDIAFALAILSIFGTGLPPAARTFLMTLAVADDLLGIIIIAVFFSSGVNFLYLALSALAIALFAFVVKKRFLKWWLLWPLAIVAWYFMHHAGVHATIAGVALGMMVPARPGKGEEVALTSRWGEAMHFYSAGIVLPIFAFFAAGVDVVDAGGVLGVFTDPVSMGIYLGLPFGKFLGIAGGVLILTKIFRLRLGNGIDMADIVPISFVAGIGFTVSLLIATLSFPASSPHESHARVGVILGSLISMVVGAILLRLRVRQRVRHPDVHHGIRRGQNARSPRRPLRVDGKKGSESQRNSEQKTAAHHPSDPKKHAKKKAGQQVKKPSGKQAGTPVSGKARQKQTGSHSKPAGKQVRGKRKKH